MSSPSQPKLKQRRRRFGRVGLLLIAATVAFGQDPREIVQKSVEPDANNFARYKDYTFKILQEQKRLDKNGEVEETESELSEVMILGGRPYERILERDGKPLSEKDAKKEQTKLDKEAEKRSKETDRDRAKFEKERREERSFDLEIPEAFDFTLLGVEQRDGIPVWKIQAEPKPGFKPKNGNAEILKKVRGIIWIDQAEYQWVAADIELLDTVSWGWFILRIAPGATITFEQGRINEEVWLPKNVHLRGNAKLGLVKTFRMDMNLAYSDYQKFTTESKIVGTEEIQ